MRAARSVQAAPFNWFEAMATGSGKPKESQTGVVSMDAPAPLIALNSEARKETAKMREKWLRESIGRPSLKTEHLIHRKDAKGAKKPSATKRHKSHKRKNTFQTGSALTVDAAGRTGY
ncbi:hypothetical protein GMLC_15850 [Geomonas limicola]|uniref:Uncharacterized protein n=1 Tax=Geomonas limicola TaxID=2740186 RepID=A0A6V8N623_9BACT|nr:hypothetical protein GMLC_15850 [Geomonas limicola]